MASPDSSFEAKKKTAPKCFDFSDFWSGFGTPDAIRTHDPQSRSLVLYPAELQAHVVLLTFVELRTVRIF